MRRGAALFLAAVTIACTHGAPTDEPVAPSSTRSPVTWASSFEAWARGRGRVVRFRGLLAWQGSDRLRAEIAAPSVTNPLILVVTPDGVLAALISERIVFRGPPSSPILEKIAGIPLDMSILSALLGGDATVSATACTADRSRFRRSEDQRDVPTLLRVECGEDRMRLSLSVPVAAPPGSRDPFALDAPPGFREVTLDGLADAMESALRE